MALRPRSDRDAGSDRIALVFAIFLAVFVLPTGWGIAAILVGMTIEIGEAAFWIRVSRRMRPASGVEALIGAEGVAASPCRPDGSVRVRGELWGAVCAEGAAEGEPVVIESVSGLTLRVRPK